MRLATAVAVAGCGAFLPAAAASPPLKDRFPVEAEFDYAPLSDACGFPVTIAFDGTFAIKVLSGPGGVLREIDTQPSTKVTFRSESGAVVLPFSAVLHATYPQGAVIGAPARLVLTGSSFGVPGFLGASTGRVVLAGTVVDIEDGFPFTRFTELISATGEVTGDEELCAALAG
ncbi:MAG TPA: hypothetical protein VFN44_06415 [Solirubrobacteraceae bacterium]|nr:hypothetical protein [Solirubrobacteraceae bacterium]